MMERSADELEVAEQLREQEVTAGRAAVARANEPQKVEGFDGVHCVDCEEPLAPVRLAYKRCRCAPCQEEEDRLIKRGLKR